MYHRAFDFTVSYYIATINILLVSLCVYVTPKACSYTITSHIASYVAIAYFSVISQFLTLNDAHLSSCDTPTFISCMHFAWHALAVSI